MSEQSQFPPGWDADRVQRVLKHYESQSELEAVARMKPPSTVNSSHTTRRVAKRTAMLIRGQWRVFGARASLEDRVAESILRVL